MPVSKTNFLFELIKSMTRGEKRHFRSFAQREGDGPLLYLKLFNILDKQETLNEKAIIDKFSKSQISNLKRHLYSQIMISLRLQERNENSLIQLREYTDFANILYGKGLYLQSLQLIEKSKKLAKKINDELILLQLLEFEKIIESRHITRSGTARVEALNDETEDLSFQIQNRLENSNLRLKLHGYYIKNGHVNSDEEYDKVQEQYKDQLDKINISNFRLIEKAYYYQSRVWFNFILLDFKSCLLSAEKWLILFKAEGKYVHRDSNLLMRAYHYILTSLYHLNDEKNYVKYLDEFENFRDNNYKKFNKNSQIISFIYVHNGRLNKYILSKEYEKGIEIIPKTLNRIKRYKSHLDTHRILVLHYKLSILYIMAGKPEMSLNYLDGIRKSKQKNLRKDLRAYTHIVFLMAHYDLKNYDIIQSNLRAIKNYFNKAAFKSNVCTRVIQFFSSIITRPVSEHHLLFQDLHTELTEFSKNKYLERTLLYLHIEEWVNAKLK